MTPYKISEGGGAWSESRDSLKFTWRTHALSQRILILCVKFFSEVHVCVAYKFFYIITKNGENIFIIVKVTTPKSDAPFWPQKRSLGLRATNVVLVLVVVVQKKIT